MPTAYVFMSTLERMGVSGFSYGDFFDAETARELSLKYRISTAFEERRLESLPALLDDYKATYVEYGEEMRQQFSDMASSLLAYFEHGDSEKLASEAKAALEITKSVYVRDFKKAGKPQFEGIFLTQTELFCANALAVAYSKSGRHKEAMIIISRLLVSARNCECCLPVYSKNLAVLLNNAALIEEQTCPEEAVEHIDEALEVVIRGAGILPMARILKNHAEITGSDRCSRLAWMLSECFSDSVDFGEALTDDRYLYVF